MADQRQELYQVLHAAKDAADSAIRTRDGEIASLRFIVEEAHLQMSSSEADIHREFLGLKDENKVIRSELAFAHSTHQDAQTLRHEFAASEALMNEMLFEFKTAARTNG